MLFKIKDLQAIQAGKITLAFRKWKQPRVKKGTLVKTAIGQVEVRGIAKVNQTDIDQQAAKDAGFEDLTDLIAVLNKRKDGAVYKIEVAYHSPDPRIAVRNQTNITAEALDQIRKKLDRMDRTSKQGEWTLSVLKVIQENPKLRAKDLAAKTGRSKDWLKPNIRKLKNLGLTISHEEGYTLSPRGAIVLSKLLG